MTPMDLFSMKANIMCKCNPLCTSLCNMTHSKPQMIVLLLSSEATCTYLHQHTALQS